MFVARALSLMALSVFAPAAAPAQPVAGTSTTIILVRHAEKAVEPKDDPALTPLGEARAMALVDAVRGAGISAIYSTRWKRTQGTARPVAEQLAIPVTTWDATPGEGDYGQAYAAELLAKHRGKVILVVGHSNTVPSILRGLGIADAPTIVDAEYDNLFIVTVPEAGSARLVRAKYGAPASGK